MNSNKKTSLLLLDDSPDLVRYYKTQIQKFSGFRVTVETDGHRARDLAQHQLFDLIVIDAKLDYRGFELGGLVLANDLRPRYGANSILVISRFITAALTRIHESDHEFMEKYTGSTASAFERDLVRKLKHMRRQQYAFVAMPFSKSYDSIYRRIRKGIKQAGLQCVRVDRVLHNRPINNVVFDLVDRSKLVVLLADDANPNAYYEAGFADAMRKEVIIVAKSFGELKFDIRDRQAIAYGGHGSLLTSQLRSKILSLRYSKPITV